MPNYLLLLHEDPAAFEQVSPEQMQAIIQKYTDWKRRMENAGVLTRGEKLQDGTGRVLRRTSDHTAITDGPYTESKEVIGGLFEIQADSYEEAIEAASGCPHLEYGAIEIREIEIH
ncbi:MAG: YciI family protein [Pyrinomonadaceae bacterium]